MRLTKHAHACLELESSGHRLVIDPGAFTAPLPEGSPVAAVVVTHEHPDHWTPEHLHRLRNAHQGVRMFAPAGVAAAAAARPESADLEFTVVADGDEHTVDGFTLQFFGHDHAVIHSSLPLVNNVGVLVNGLLYYPGDSYTVPPMPVHTLAAPAAAPWLKIGEAMDFVAAVAPRRAFPTHQAGLSEIGEGMHYARLRDVTEQGGGEFVALAPGESLEL